MKFLGFVILFSLLSFNVYADLIITEILAKPIQDDDWNEYVEIYNNGDSPINIENLILCNNKLESGYINKQDSRLYDNLSSAINPGSYALITDGGTGTEVYTNFNPQGIALHTNSSTLCNRLSNSGKEVSLYLNSIKISSVTYPTAQEGLSWSLINETWMNSNTTPGYPNFILIDEGNTSNQSTQQNVTNTTIVNITSLSNYETATNDCDWQVSILINNTLFSNASELKWKIIILRNKGYKTNLSFKRSITDKEGRIVKDYGTLNLSITNKRSFAYSPNLHPGSYLINNEITTSCNDINLSNNKDSVSIQIGENEILNDSLEEITINEDSEGLQIKETKSKKTIENKTETNLNSNFGSITGKAIYDKQSTGGKKAIYIFVASLVLLIAYFVYKGKNERTEDNLKDDSRDSGES